MSNRQAIIAKGLGKAYRIGLARHQPDTLVAAIRGSLTAPFRNYRDIRGLGRVSTKAANHEVDPTRFWALRDVSFEAASGEVIGIIGRNGAGKSTLLKILSRITDPTTGEAEIHGRVSSLLEVGTGFHPELTGRENVYMNGTILGMSKREIDIKFDQIVEFAGVERFLDTPIKRYSSGMQVRLAFSVAAHLEPQILVIDEVLAVGDAEFQKRCLGKMREVAGGGRTVLFVSHNMSAIGQLCTSGLLLSQGRITARGPLDDVIKAYMDDLFQTRGAIDDGSTRVAVTTAIDGDQNERIWRHRSVLTVQVELETEQATEKPAIDIYFHSSAGRMIFARSDRFLDSSRVPAGRRHVFAFRFENNGFVSDYMTLDIGFRYAASTQYVAMWQSLAAVALGPVPPGFSHGRECPVAVPCQVEMLEAAA